MKKLISLIIVALLIPSLIFAGGGIGGGPIGTGGQVGGVGTPGGAAGSVQCNVAGSFGACTNLDDIVYALPNANTTGNAGTATALAANGANCPAGNYPLGIDASGAVESCTSAPAAFSAASISGATGDSTPATTSEALLNQGGSLIKSTLGQIGTALGIVDWTADQGATNVHANNIPALSYAPPFGTLTNTKWCTTDGTTVACTENAPQPALGVLAGTLTNTYLCKYTAAGTVLSCDVNPASFQAAGSYETADATILKEAEIVNALDSTSTTAPLSAAQGKALQDGKQATDADYASLAAGISGPVVGLGNGNGYRTIASTDLLPSDEIVAGGGTVDAITANYTIDKTLADKTIARFRSAGANTSATPSFAPDGLTAHTIVKHGGVALVAGDIGAAGMICVLQYDLANTRWELLNPIKPSGDLAVTVTYFPSDNTGATGGTVGKVVHHADSTASNSGGALELSDGAQVQTFVTTGTNYTIITKTEYLPIAYAEDGAAGPAAASVWADTRKAKIRVFAADADDDVEIHWIVPNDYVGGIKFRAIGFVDNATAPANTETVIFNLAGCSVGDSDDGGCTLGTGVDATFTADANYAQHDRWATAWSNEITVTNIAAGESAMLKLFRDVDDTYGQGIGVAGIEIRYKAKIIGIAGY